MYLKNRKSVVSGRCAVVTALLLLVAVTLIASTRQSRNAEAQKLKNPETSNPESIEAGKKLYLRHCASCHGQGGKGDGGMALSGGTPSDLTDEKWDYGSSDGEIFTAIREGVSADMLEYKNKLDDQQIWQVVIFLRSIGPQPAKEK